MSIFQVTTKKGQSFNKAVDDIENFPSNLKKAVNTATVKLINNLRNIVLLSLRPPKHGRIYTWREVNPGEKADFFIGGIPAKKRDIPHRASAPGEPPAIDTGQMRSRLVFDFMPQQGIYKFGSESKKPPYPLDLEVGTGRVAARPWMKPAIEKLYPTIEPLVLKEIKNIKF